MELFVLRFLSLKPIAWRPATALSGQGTSSRIHLRQGLKNSLFYVGQIPTAPKSSAIDFEGENHEGPSPIPHRSLNHQHLLDLYLRCNPDSWSAAKLSYLVHRREQQSFDTTD